MGVKKSGGIVATSFGNVQSGGVRGRRLAFVAGGAMLGVDVVHGDFEHVVAADADAMDL